MALRAVASELAQHVPDLFVLHTFRDDFSVGDVLIVLGLFLIVHRLCESYMAYVLARLGDAVLGPQPARRSVHLPHRALICTYARLSGA